jgi:hypothetical protein
MPLDVTKIALCKIHPAIGIARLGNHLTEFFIGPETPGNFELPASFKLGDPPAVKRQGARFRIFAYDTAGNTLGELTPAEADIKWKVHLVNAKAEWDLFEGRTGESLPLAQRRPNQKRNTNITNRNSLIIDGGAQTVSRNQSARFSGTFLGSPVELGELRCGDDGRLTVLGGRGKSETLTGSIIQHYANNDGWHDDTADGSVEASVVLSNGSPVDVAPAWVIVAPPDFAPSIDNVVTLWDVVEDVATRRGVLNQPATPSFTGDIYPILSRAIAHQWLNELAARGHGPGGQGDFTPHWAELANPGNTGSALRQFVFKHVRNPRLLAKFIDGTATPAEKTTAVNQANETFMPALSGDSGDSQLRSPDTWLTVTDRQYDMLFLWKEGTFTSDWHGIPPVPPVSITPQGLDRAALESCTGGAFYPGIECGWIVRHAEIYSAGEIARLNPEVVKPGDMTKRMAVPWQADFFECNTHWWPSQRPDSVFSEADFHHLMQLDQQIAQSPAGSDERSALEQQRADLITTRTAWWPDAWPQNDGSAEHKGDRAMVDRWFRLGFVVPRQSAGTTVFVNTEAQT